MVDKRFLLHVSLGGKPSRDRIAEAATQIKALIDGLSSSHQLAYTSSDGGTFGFILNSSLDARQIVSRVNNPGNPDKPQTVKPSPLRHDDSMFVIEVGTDSAGVGKSRLAGWLKFHRPGTTPEAESIVDAAEPEAPSQLASQLLALKDKLGKS